MSSLFPLRRTSRDRVTLGVQGLVIDAERRVLLVRHGYRPGWHFPGGGVERDEPVLEALRRELIEETGVELAGPPELVGLFANFESFRGDHIALFRVMSWKRERIPAPNAEIAETGFFAVDALPPDTTPGAVRRLDELFRGAPSSDKW